MIVDQVRGIRVSLEYSTLDKIQTDLDRIAYAIFDYPFNNKTDSNKQYEIDKLNKILKNREILKMKYFEIPKFIDKIINILEFIEI